MSLRGVDIRHHEFTRRRVRGLDPQEVSGFLAEVAEAHDALLRVNASLIEQHSALEEDSRSVARREQALIETMTTAQQIADQIRGAAEQDAQRLLTEAQHKADVVRASAEERAECLLREAQDRAQTIVEEAASLKTRSVSEAAEELQAARSQAASLVGEARVQETAIRSDIESLARARGQLVDDMRATLQAYHQWLSKIDPRGRAKTRRPAGRAAESGDAASLARRG
jgi:DivIVA domain-containing protein